MCGRVKTALFAIVLMLAAATCGPVATHGRPVPSAGGGVVGIKTSQDQAIDSLDQGNFNTGRALSAAGTTTSLPYVPPSELQRRSWQA